MTPLEDLLQQCTVKIIIPDGWGTGFFVAPGLMLTCAHVVRKAVDFQVTVFYPARQKHLSATVQAKADDGKTLDLALIELVEPLSDHPCVLLDEEPVAIGQALYSYGYLESYTNAAPVRPVNEGWTGDTPPLLKLQGAQIEKGISGAALLNLKTGKICGMVKETRAAGFDLGGGAIPTRVILEQFPQLRDLQREFHGSVGVACPGDNRRWSSLISESSEIDFQPYLQSVTTTYAKWWQLYTLTDAAGKLRQEKDPAPMFDFGLMVQTVVKETQEREKEKIERFSVLEGIRKYADQQVLLVGRPGSGKSTALARLLLEEATTQNSEAHQTSEVFKTSEVSAHSPRIPVLVELRYWQGALSDLIHNAIARHDPTLKAVSLDGLLTNALLLFDGVNELPSEEARSQLIAFRRNHPKLPMIFTTRDLSLGGDLGIEQKLEMQPLTEPQMQAFIRAYVPGQAEAMLQQLKARLREFGQTPLLLWMLCSLFQQTGEIPENLGMVFRLFTQGYERKLKQDVVIESDRAWWQPVLQQLAWVMMQGTQPTELRAAIPREEAVRAIAQFLNGKVPYAEDFTRKCLRDLQKHHLIQAGTNPEELEFRHQLLQEYYAAEWLLERVEQMDDETLACDYLNYLKWTEPVALMLSLLEENSEQAKHLRDLAWDVDWNLWINLDRKTNSRPQESSLDNLFGRRWLDEDNVQSLLKKLNSRVRYICTEATENLKFNASDSISKPERANFDSVIESLISLIERVEKSQDRGREEGTQILVKLGSEECIPTLLEILDEDPDTFVRIDAAWALEKLGSEECVPTLLRVFNNADDHFLRSSAARALVEIGSKASIQGIINATDHSDPEIRRCAAWAIGFSNSETAIPVLLKAIEDVNSEVRCRAVRSLGGFESEVAIQSIFKALEDSSSTVRLAAIKALMKTNSEMKTSELTKAINDSDEHVRFEVAKALAELGSEVAIPELLQVMKKWMPCAGEVIRALGEINSEASLLELIKLFDLPEYDDRLSLQFGGMICPGEPIHRVVANVLSEVNINSESLALELINAVDNSEPMIRESIGKLLKNITFKGAVPKLEQLINHSDLNIRKGVIEALGNIGSEATVRKLIEVIEDPLPEIRSIAVKALAKLDFKPVIPTLLRAAEDSDFYVRANAITGLGEIGSEDAVLVLSKIIDEPNREYDRAEYDIFNFDKNPNSVIRGEAVTALGRIASKDAIEVLLKAIGHTNGYVRESVARVFEEINCEVAIKYLSRLQEIHRSTGWYEASKAIASIQNRCQFYNYEIFQAHLNLV